MTGTGLLVKVRGDGAAFAAKAGAAFELASAEVTSILRIIDGVSEANQFGADAGSTWLRFGLPVGAGNPWDAAHALLTPRVGFAASDIAEIEVVEPDILQSWLPLPPIESEGVAATERCAFADQNAKGGKAVGTEVAWNRGTNFSGVDDALAAFGDSLEAKLSQVVIAHLDTGYDAGHITKPVNLDLTLQRNFVDAGFLNDARDRTPEGQRAVRNRGHGTATLALLAGNRLDGTTSGWSGYTGFIGGAPYATVIPIRIADWVVRFTTSTMVQGFDHARANGAQVLSMSMGGLTSFALVDAINLAYDAGMVMVTAAGNNFSDTPMPRSTVFPARYRRVLAACGVMADGRAYAGLHDNEMQGDYGPAAKMATSLGAYTPNVAWAMIDCGKGVGMDGAGTSAATPQIAAAAALWLAKHRTTVQTYPQPWMRVEAVRQALFSTASKTTAIMGTAETFEKIGQGVMRINAALAVHPAAAPSLVKLPPTQASFGWIDLLFNGGVSFAAKPSGAKSRMLALELTQMAQLVPEVDAAVGDNDTDPMDISPAARQRYLEAALDNGNPSAPLRAALERILGRPQSLSTPTVPPTFPPTIRRKVKEIPPPSRRLRVYALDPSVAKSLDSVSVNATVLEIPWEEGLKPGPVGEYIEVVDVDPASNRIYDPVDLNEPKLLAQDGWPPSEGNPQFHQQMVYAVAMTTIGHFEAALGRRALWAPRRGTAIGKDGKEHPETYEVQRLRIYPHALRTDNAYYSPDKVALLFGYFRADSRLQDATAPGSMVFACLSADIVAHEMSHALLDGLHRRLQEASNPDVPAFHEAFADIVAVFEHFAIPELVRFQIARAGGHLSGARLLGGLAQQFGEGTQRGGPLRDYLSDEVRKLDYTTTTEVHARGSILVSAVFDAFLKIFDRKTADLVRLATSGTGILPKGALHPDLVNRLTDEACRTARQVLRMCIRALDYCPAVDITFGEYLRALITADMDIAPADPLSYRVAFMEAFRIRNILPRGVRTVSEETLAWATLEETKPRWLDKILVGLDLGWDRALSRSDVFTLNERNRWKVWSSLKTLFAAEPDLLAQFGLLADVPRYRDDGTVHHKAAPGETTFEVFNVRSARRVALDGSFRVDVIMTIQQRQRKPVDPATPDGAWFWFRGGATLIIDPREGHREVRYSIIKSSGSVDRLNRQRQTVSGEAMSPLRALYFGMDGSEPFAILHSNDGEIDHG